MDYLAIIQLAVQYGPAIASLIQTATTNADLQSKLQASVGPLAGILEGVGAKLFPHSASSLHLVAGALASFNPDRTKWLQGALNTMLTPSPNLKVDGIYGAATRDAVMKLQEKLGLKVDGVAGQLTYAAMQAAFSK